MKKDRYTKHNTKTSRDIEQFLEELNMMDDSEKELKFGIKELPNGVIKDVVEGKTYPSLRGWAKTYLCEDEFGAEFEPLRRGRERDDHAYDY